MSGLPWFGFDIKDFIADTLRLNTEAKGAYLMLLLDYYQKEQGCPATPSTLATVTGLSLESWTGMAPVILPLFEIKDGHLFHQRCETEIEKGRRLHAGAVKAAGASVASRKAKRDAQRPPTVRPTASQAEIDQVVRRAFQSSNDASSDRSETNVTPTPVERTQQPTVNDPSTHIQEQEHIEDVSSNDDTTRGEPIGEGLIPKEFTISGLDVIRCQNEGYGPADISPVLDGFKRYHEAAGTFSNDWSGMWWRWWDRKKPALAPKAKPRIEVSTRAPAKRAIPPDWKPNQAHAVLAAEEGYAIADIEASFRDSCAANGYVYANHDAAFRNFIKNQKKFDRRPTNGKAPTGGSRGTIADASRRLDTEIDRRIAEATEADQRNGDDAVRVVSEG